MQEFATKYSGLALLLFMSAIALLSFKGYGLAWDEPMQRETGLVNYQYVFSDNQDLLTWKDRDYGPAFELPLIAIEKVLNPDNTRTVFLTRHLATHLFFLMGAFFCFLLIDLLYKNKLLATIGFFMIVLQPRLYAHSFFNSKDIPFMAMFLVSFYLSALAFKKKTLLRFIALGIATGLLINLRIMGVLLPCCIVLFLLLDAIREQSYIHHLKLTLVFLFVSAIVLYASWPFLWNDPFGNFVLAFENMSKFPWDGIVLFKGEFVKTMELGWDYVPVWFSITTPVVYLAAGLMGIGLLIYQVFRKPLPFLNNVKERNNLLYIFCFFVPVIAVIVLHSVLYDGWRQMYFIYPSFVLLAVYGLDFLFKKKLKGVAIAFFVVSFSFSSFFMLKNFPVQQVYFNSFFAFSPPEYLRKHFEMDYWGASYKQSLEYILENDTSLSINICFANEPGYSNLNILRPDERTRLHLTPRDEAGYFITNYRWHPQDYEKLNEFSFYSLKVADNTVSEIFKLK
jgi:hypothetical protein